MFAKKNVLPLIILVIFLALPFLMILPGQTSKENPCSKVESNSLKLLISDIKKDFPHVEYANEKIIDEARKVKSEKYNNGLGVSSPDISKDIESFSTLSWEKGLTALPVKESDIVIVGKVVDAKAHLSTNKQSVYSEFKIEIENIFKNSEQKFENGKYVTAEREGGIVRYPSGYEFWHHVRGQQMPVVDRRYVFFLTHNFPVHGYYKHDFYILTAYELREGRVLPLDNPGDLHPIVSVYKGKNESVLLNDLQNVFRTQ